MSFQAVAWAKNQKCNTPLTKLVLVWLCQYADEENSCYPSQKHLADLCESTDRSVRRSLKWLEDNNMIKIKNRDGTSNRYFMSMDIDVHPSKEADVHTPRTPKSYNNKDNKKDISNDGFDVFWKVYPRKDGKSEAQKKYIKSLNKISKEDLYWKLRSQMRIWNNEKRDGKYIPMASTWLNQERFLDELLESNEKNKLNSLAG